MTEQARMSGLATDLYQLTMGAAYHANGRNEPASFELFVRKFPAGRSYLIAGGLKQALDYLSELSFSGEEIDYLRGLPVFEQVQAEFFEYLRTLRFTGEVWALREGTIVFPGEPLLRVTAPLIEAQMVETFLLTTINFQTLIATKAARIVEAARGRGIIEFGARRCHSFGAAIYAARAAFIGGCLGTSNVEAGRLFEIPVYGTSAHSFTMAFDHELDAFRAYYRVFPESTTLLIDTYDTIGAANLATEFGPRLRGVRLDSGDMIGLSKEVRAILDEAGMQATKIMASGDLDEYKIAKMIEAGAPIDLFGVGTELSTSRDAPALAGVYKLAEIEISGEVKPKMKLSPDKATYPYRKQVWRESDHDGSFKEDLITIADEVSQKGEPLLTPVMRGGEIIGSLPRLEETQAYAKEQLSRLPLPFKRLTDAAHYPVRYSDELERRRLELLKTVDS